ncbi:tensin-4 [Clonorchis sinensis]|uniref:Tensin-4 n=1 Tax=Clonorchis sinensis TaxID=79923 RepID=G7YD13_CLOSI|nr:tensin-4 [Clonorchis sinensis]
MAVPAFELRTPEMRGERVTTTAPVHVKRIQIFTSQQANLLTLKRCANGDRPNCSKVSNGSSPSKNSRRLTSMPFHVTPDQYYYLPDDFPGIIKAVRNTSVLWFFPNMQTAERHSAAHPSVMETTSRGRELTGSSSGNLVINRDEDLHSFRRSTVRNNYAVTRSLIYGYVDWPASVNEITFCSTTSYRYRPPAPGFPPGSVGMAYRVYRLPGRRTSCNLLYLGQFSVGTQSAGYAIKMCVDHVLGRSQLNADPTVIEFRVNENGITMTDLSQRKFSQRHYPTDFLQFIGVDPLKRNIFGFVSCNPFLTPGNNQCHLLSEYDDNERASVICDFTQRYLNLSDL